jgi:uncharacterized protein with HEPN domain
MSRDAVVIEDIKNAIRLAIEFARDIDRSEFEQDVKTQSAVIHQLLIMGEAVKRLSLECRESRADLPWKLMAGMRDVLIHGYDVVDTDEVWQTVKVDLPAILSTLDAQ